MVQNLKTCGNQKELTLQAGQSIKIFKDRNCKQQNNIFTDELENSISANNKKKQISYFSDEYIEQYQEEHALSGISITVRMGL